SLAIVVGGGPAPGINGVISAATIEAINRGIRVYGIYKGFERVGQGDRTAIKELTIADVSRIHLEGGAILGTSRANPRGDQKMLDNIVALLKENDIKYLVSIGGDDTVSSARAIAKAAGGNIAVAHTPKTIDNDLPIPGHDCTFGYQTAREVGTRIVETLMTDAKTTSRWYLTIAMGRKAGHLALGIGVSAGATITLIPEEFGAPNSKLALSTIVDTVVGSILKRVCNGQQHGVAVLAEGLAEILDPDSVPELANAERDPHGHIRLAEVDFGGMVKRAVRDRLSEFGVDDIVVVDKNIGYELRCKSPSPFDREYTRQLGYGVVDFLQNGGSDAMIIRQGENLEALPFDKMFDDSGRSLVRLVDIESTTYKVASKYMIRITEEDLTNPDFLSRLEGVTNASAEKLKETFAPIAFRERGCSVKIA
ncbi:UNVERIFIED_CONTAM: hypothetical protein GTU68_016357, partial [Idotea baltica]|nr:hypothetical protein [Idotea baltica]